MKIKKPRKTSKKIIALYVVVIAIMLSAGAFTYVKNFDIFGRTKATPTPSIGPNLLPATSEEKAAGNQAKSSNANTDSTGTDSTKGSNPTTTTPGSPTSPATVNVQTTANVQNGSTYQLRYLINSIVNNATCTLTLTQGTKTITKTAKTQALAQSSTCEGFDMPTSSLDTGSWQATMTVSGGGITGSITNTIQVK